MKIALLDPFHSGSHKAWSTGLEKHSSHEIRLFTLPGSHWKWRMHGAAVTLANTWLRSGFQADVILTTDMLALDTFAAICRNYLHNARLDVFFHENQLTYPWSATDPDTVNGRDNHYAFINLTSALAADRVFFNSHYHRKTFLEALPAFCSLFPQPSLHSEIESLNSKCKVLNLGVDLSSLDVPKPARSSKPVILWNHRWEYDKGPDEFFSVLTQLREEQFDFELIVVGEQFTHSPPVFQEARHKLSDRILHWGFVTSRQEYAGLLKRADILPVTSKQDFFGISVVEAIYCDVFPLLPDRLAYPEHIPKAEYPQCFYQSRQELLEQLRQLLSQPSGFLKQDYSHYMKRYDWPHIINQYDARL